MNNSRVFKFISFIVLFFFSWTFGGMFDIAYAVKSSGQWSAVSDQQSAFSRQHTKKEKRPEEKLSQSLDDIEQILTDFSTDIDKKKSRLKTKRKEIDEFDVAIKKRFRKTEDKLIRDGLPERILKRHQYFKDKIDNNLSELKRNLDAIDNAVNECDLNLAIEKAKTHLNKLKSPKKQQPVDPNKLPHRAAEPVFKDPRTSPEQFRNNQLAYSDQRSAVSDKEDSDQRLAVSYQLFPTLEKGGEGGFDPGPILLASARPLNGLLSQDSEYLDSPSPLAGEGWGEGGPFTSALPILNTDKNKLSDYLLLAQASNPPTAADLAENIEVQFTPAITAKAAELGNDPVKIYNWIRNNIEFAPTYGSIQGADYCLQTKLCNAFDTSSLLISLMRASNIHARYVEGTVEIPIEKVKNWLGGFTDSSAALELIASGGIPVTGLTSGGEIVMVRMEHVWVEAYVDYIPYRGAVNVKGDTWIPLDASFKQYNIVDGIDVNAAVPTDIKALLVEVESLSSIDDTVPSITGVPSQTIQNQISEFQTRLREYMANNIPDVNNYYDHRNKLLGNKEVVPKNLRFLPNSLEMKVIAKSVPYSEIPNSLRHTISFKVGTFLESNPLEYSTSLPELAGKRVTLSYAPASPDDAQVMANSEGILDFPLYLVNVIPELKIEGQTVATGQGIGMGKEQAFQITFSKPNSTTSLVNNNIQAGEYYAVGVDINRVNFQYLNDRVNSWQPDTADDRDDRLGELLYLTSMFYFARADYFNEELALSSEVVNLRQPSENLVGMKINASYVFGVPLSVNSVGLNMDVDLDIISPVSKISDNNAKLAFMIQSGLYASGLEHFLFEYLMDFEAISAIKALDLASQQNIPIYIIDSENSHRVDELMISGNDRQDIKNLINAGRTVLVPQTSVQHFDYSGIGYVAVDLQTGAGAYMISGGYAGGDTVEENVQSLVDLADNLLGKNKKVAEGYKTAIEYILEEYPDIVSTPNEKFKEWTELVLHSGYAAKRLPLGNRVKTIIAQQILYNIVVNLIALSMPF